MFARFDENPAMTLRVIKETKRYGRTDRRTDARTDGRTDNVKTVYPLQTNFAGGIITEKAKTIYPLYTSYRGYKDTRTQLRGKDTDRKKSTAWILSRGLSALLKDTTQCLCMEKSILTKNIG